MTSDYPGADGKVHGGVGAATFSLARALNDLSDLDVSVLVPMRVPSSTSATLTRLPGEGPTVLRLSLPTRGRTIPEVLWQHPHLVSEAIGAIPHDVLHIQGGDRLAARHPKDTTLLTIHGLAERDALFHPHTVSRWPRHLALKALCSHARRRVRNFVVINPYVREAITFGRNQRVWDIPNAVHESFFDVIAQPHPGRIVLPGRVMPIKNTLAAIRAFSITATTHQHATLHILGSGDKDYVSQCQGLTRALGLVDRVRFRGSLGMPALQQELAEAQITALCSLQENAPMVISESMAIGVPVIATDVGGVCHMVRDGHTGIVLPEANPAALAAAFNRLLSSDTLRAQMATNAREAGSRIYHPRIVGLQTKAVYQRLVGERSAASHAMGLPATHRESELGDR